MLLTHNYAPYIPYIHTAQHVYILNAHAGIYIYYASICIVRGMFESEGVDKVS